MTHGNGGATRRAADVVIVGGGPAGVAVAERLIVRSGRRVLLLEAGPDFGPLAAGSWPDDLLDPTLMPVTTHSWGYASSAKFGMPGLPLERARMIGGCSSHNGCAAVWGHRADYDGWAARGNPGWEAETLLPLFQEANRRWHVVVPPLEEITPWHRACMAAGPTMGLPAIPDLNDLDVDLGIAVAPVNIKDRLRWSVAFALLDPIRDHPRFALSADTLVDRLRFAGTRCVGVEAIGPEGRVVVDADAVILAGGTFGSPSILLRSGVGPADELRPLGIAPTLDLPGVGRNLQEHPAFPVRYAGTDRLVAAMEAFVADGGLPREEGTIGLARSSRCAGPFDLHLYPIGARPFAGEGWRFNISSAVMTPKSTGSVRLASADPEAAPIIDPGFFTDPEDHDLEALLDGVALARELGAQAPLADLAGAETWPGPERRARAALREFVRRNAVHDYHPTSSCAMGPASDPTAVVDARGRVHGLEGVLVADASIMPVVPRANTNVPTLVTALRVADRFLAGE